MSDFDPGPGWSEVQFWETKKGTHLILENVSDGKPTGRRYWIHEAEVPPLPTAPYTVILTKGKRGFGDWVMVWYGEQWHQTANGTAISAIELLTLVDSFVVVSEPRAVTAKAVLDRVMITGISGPAVDDLYREFGVQS